VRRLIDSTARTSWANQAHSRQVYSPAIYLKLQNTHNDIMGVPLIQFRLAIATPLLVSLPIVVPIALVFLCKLKTIDWVAEARTDRFHSGKVIWALPPNSGTLL